MLLPFRLKTLIKFTALWLCWLLILQSAFILATPKFAIKLADLRHLPPLQIGDWVLRAGTVVDSHIIMEISQGDYSHIGMVVQTEPEIRVIHATTDDGYDEKNQVFLSPLTEFLSPTLAQNYLILRPRFLNSIQKQKIAVYLMQQQGKPFVLAPRNEPHLYCSTLLETAIKTEYPDFAPQWSILNAPLFKGEYLFPNAFEHYPNLSLVYRSSQ